MIKKLNVLLLVCILLMAAAGCSGSQSKSSASSSTSASAGSADGDNSELGERISVVTTIFPPYDYVREIAGDQVSLTQLLPPGAESHSFEPGPADIISIQECDIFIYNGGESDSWVDRILQSMDISDMEIVKMTELVPLSREKLVEGMEKDKGDDHDHGYEYDEHVWTSPVNAQKIVSGISDALIKKDPKNSGSYKDRTAAYIDSLSRLDGDFRELSENAASHLLIFGDRFPFRYFADEYGFSYYAAFPGCSAETEASASTVAFLIDKVKAENVRAVFHIEFSNESMADTIAAETGAKKMLLHSCHNVSKKDIGEGVSYLSLMEQNLHTLEEALS